MEDPYIRQAEAAVSVFFMLISCFNFVSTEVARKTTPVLLNPVLLSSLPPPPAPPGATPGLSNFPALAAERGGGRT